jgi:ribosome-associated protein
MHTVDGDDDRPEPPGEVPIIGEVVDENARSRTSLKRERVNNEKALADLVLDLLPLSEDKWRKLGVPEETIDTLIDASKIKAHGARGRQMRLVRSTLRGVEWSLIRRGLDRLKAGLTLEGSPTSAPSIDWSEQLLVQGDPGLARFVEEFPRADRKRLRQLIRNVKSAPSAKRGKARIQLERAVAQELLHADDDEHD